MQEGFIVIKDGREILWIVLSRNAGFDSELCAIARELFLTGDVDACKKALVSRITEIQGFPAKERKRRLYARAAENRSEYIPPYAYEYDVTRHRLTLYMHGAKTSVFERREIDYFDFFVKNYARILHGFGRVYRDFTIDECKAWDAFNVRKKFGKTLADIDYDLRCAIAENSIIVGPDEQDFFDCCVANFMKRVSFYDRDGKETGGVWFSVYYSRNNEAGRDPDYRLILESEPVGYTVLKAPTIRALRRRLAKKIKSQVFIDTLRRFSKLEQEEFRLRQRIVGQWKADSFDEQTENLPSFIQSMEKDIRATYSSFSDDDFTAITSQGFCLADRQSDMFSKLSEYRDYVLDPPNPCEQEIVK